MRYDVSLRPAQQGDLPAIVAVYNHYVQHTAATFEVRPVTVEERAPWLEAHSRGGAHRLIVAVDGDDDVRGWACTSEFRPRAAYGTTVEASVYCRADSLAGGIGSRLYRSLFRAIEGEDLERIVAGITLPNAASVELHRRFGFHQVGTFTRVGRKFGRFWDVAWFERPSHPEPDPPAPAAGIGSSDRGAPSFP